MVEAGRLEMALPGTPKSKNKIYYSWREFISAYRLSCFAYGDMLTKLVFDVNNEEFKKIQSCKVKVIGGMFGEYESEKLLPEINYPLSDLNTIRLIFSMVQNNIQLCTIFYAKFWDLEDRLRKFGFTESVEMVHFLKEEFEKDVHLSKDKMMHLIDQYIYEIKLEKE